MKRTFRLQKEKLADAAKKNDIDKVTRLIESGASVNSTNEVSVVVMYDLIDLCNSMSSIRPKTLCLCCNSSSDLMSTDHGHV